MLVFICLKRYTKKMYSHMLIWDTNSHFEYNYIDFKDISEMIMP